jgi:hypothetical protein
MRVDPHPVWGLLKALPYLIRLRKLQALTLSNMRTFADMVFVFRCLHGLVNFSATDIGFDLVTFITRGSGCRLKQRHINSATKNLFAERAVTTWNSLPNSISTCKSIGQFKCMLRTHLISLQCWVLLCFYVCFGQIIAGVSKRSILSLLLPFT